MFRIKNLVYTIGTALFLCFCLCGCTTDTDDIFISRIVDPTKETVLMYWKDDEGKTINNLDNLRHYTQSKSEDLIFAMNGGMFQTDYSPLGLYIENYKVIHGINTDSGRGNFYLKPNGVFMILPGNKGVVCETDSVYLYKDVQYATQSGPMLVINGTVNPIFNKNSDNYYIRNGVGILPNGNIVFCISKKTINLYNFAQYFKQLGCINALYLDGFVSRVYYSEKNIMQKEGNLGVLIGITKPR